MGIEQPIDSVSEEREALARAFRGDVLAGFAQPRKAIPARWLYDARGSQLFDEITRLPEYYPTRTETAILRQHGAEIAAATGPGRVLVEFGSGSSTKTPLVLRAIAPSAYVPVDISGDHLHQAVLALGWDFPVLAVYPVEADFTRPFPLPRHVLGDPMLGFFPGSTIGNMVPASAVDLLRSIRGTLGDGAQLLIGFDTIKDERTLRAAYDDAQGVTAAFNRNVLTRINRELEADIPVDRFVHRIVWNDSLARIEMHLEAIEDVRFSISGRRFFVRAGEAIHTENSHKYDPRTAAVLLLAGGWTPLVQWQDEAGQFLVMLAVATEPRMAP